MPWSSSILHHRVTLTKSAKIIVFLALVLYLINRFVYSLDMLIPWGMMRYHLNDLCGGVLFPLYVDMISAVIKKRRLITSLPRALSLSAACSICWEVIAPLFLPYSTGDPLDAVAYTLGIIAYQQAMQTKMYNRPENPKASA